MEGFYAEVDESSNMNVLNGAPEDTEFESQSVPSQNQEDSHSEDNDKKTEDQTENYEMEGFGNYNSSFSLMEFVKRLLKYLVEGLVVAIAASTIPKKALDLQEVGVIALSAAATFALLDLFAPTISYAARQGAGFGVGANLVGFPRF